MACDCHPMFAGGHRGAEGKFIAGESAISLVRYGTGAFARERPGHASIGVETRRGTERLHGQVSLFNRQRLLSAQNPFTAWVKETEPGSGSRVPTFAVSGTRLQMSNCAGAPGTAANCIARIYSGSARWTALRGATPRLPGSAPRPFFCATSERPDAAVKRATWA